MLQTIAVALTWAQQQNIPAADAAILLAHVLHVSRSHLIAFPERTLTADEQVQFKKFIAQCMQGMPVAYLVGHREFWSLDLVVTPETLIPRPETELLVELVLQQVHGENKQIADLGTGSGAIALAIAHERPTWQVCATDASIAALAVAKENARRLHINNVSFYAGDWCAALPVKQYDVIVSNPPYIAADDPHLQSNLRYEPQAALVAAENGLSDLQQLITQAYSYLKPGGYLFVEHGYEQAADARRFFSTMGYTTVNSYRDLAGHERVTGGCHIQ